MPPTTCLIDADGRECASCRVYKPWSDYSPEKRARTMGHRSNCKECQASKLATRRAENPDAYTLMQFESGLRRKFNISLEQYRKLEAEQGGVCALCGQPETRVASGKNTDGVKVQSLSVDHDHQCCPGVTSCGKCVRGLLCARCNWLVGRLEGAHGRQVLSRLSDYVVRRPFKGGS